MRRFWRSSSFFLALSIIFGFLLIYRQVIFEGKIIFPSNFLAQFYSPWRTDKFLGWEVGIPHKPIGDDQIRLFYPERKFTNEMLAKQTIPLWNPYTFAGTPFLANFQSAIFYPLNILYFFLPQIYSWGILQLIQPIMALLFMYFFLKLFRLHNMAVWMGAVSFGLSGFMLVWSQENVVVGQTALWLPLVLYGIEGHLATKKFWYYSVAIIALTCSLLAGFFQITFYIFLFSFLYSIFRIKSLNLTFFSYFLKIISIYIFSLLLSALQLLPSIEAFLESPRGTSSAWYLFEDYLLPITHMLNAFVPDIFGNPGAYNFFGRGFYRETVVYAGLIPFVFAVYACFKTKKNHAIRFFMFSLIISFFLTLDSPFTRWFFQLPLPLLPTFLPSRILFLTSFSIATLSAFGFSVWMEKRSKSDSRLMFYILAVFLITFFLVGLYGFLLLKFGHFPIFKQLNDYITRHGSFLTTSYIVVLLKNLILPFIMLFIFFIFVSVKKIPHLFCLGIIALVLFGQFYFLNKYVVVGEPQFLYPKNPVISFLQSRDFEDRFVTFRQPFEENISTYFHIYSIEGANPVFPRRYGELLFAVKNGGKLVKDIPRIEARLSELGDKENPFEDNRKMRLLSLLGVKYVLYFDDHNPKNINVNKFPSTLFTPVWQNKNWYGLEYTNVFPRVFLVNNIITQENPQKILDLIFDPNTDLLNTIILEEKPKDISGTGKFIDLSTPSSDSTASIASYNPQEINIHVKTNVPQMLFLSDNYYPGWKAYVDGKETKIYRADYTFRSIYLPAGNHTAIFKYDPMSFKIGLSISIFSVIVILLFIVKNFKNSNFWIRKDRF